MTVKKTYQLTQQTPMIHFQSNEDGATLRASEVKPKLDRFILAQLGGEATVRQAHPDWFVSGEHPALNYKLRFVAASNSKTVSIPYSIFYANMGEERKRNPLKMIVGDCSLTMVCFVPALADKIDALLADFFIASTFGFMQGKGFGGYILYSNEWVPSNSQIKNALQSVLGCGEVYAMQTSLPTVVVKEQRNGKPFTPENVFDSIIKPFHSLMKSGINFGKYERSYLFQYFHDNANIQYGNDKACVKSTGIAPVVFKTDNAAKGEHIHSYADYKYVRALLGISEKIEYIHALDAFDKPLKDCNGRVIKDIVTIKSTSAIERYASPVCYRIIGNQVYVFAAPLSDELSEDFYGSKFTFSSETGTTTISVPDKDDFGIETFLSAFVKHISTNNNTRAAARFYKEKFERVSQ